MFGKKQAQTVEGEQEVRAKVQKKNIFTKLFRAETLPRTLLISLVFLLPLFYLPSSIAILLSAKMFLVYVVGVTALLVVLAKVFRSPQIQFPISFLTIVGLLVPVTYLIAGVLSRNPNISFFGRDFAQDSVMAVIALFGILAVTAISFKEKFTALYAYTAVCVSGVIAVIVHLLNITVPAMPPLGYFGAPIATVLGKWNDLGLFTLLLLMVTVLALQYLRFSKIVKGFLYGVVVLSSVLLIIINYTLVWWALGIFSLLMTVRTFVRGKKEGSQMFSKVTISLFVVSAIFLAFGQPIGNRISQVFNIQHLEVRPSIEATLTVAQQSLSGSRIVYGVGPALFENEWPKFRPQSVLTTNFWDVDFRYGFGLLPSFIITTGLLGGIAWLLFLAALLWVTVKTLRTPVEDVRDRFLLTTGAFTSWFLWATMFFYLPSTTLAVFTFIFTGLFFASATKNGILSTKNIVPQKKAFVLVSKVVVIILMLAVAGIGVKAATKFVAHVYFQQSVAVLAATNDAKAIETNLARAVRLDPIDTYFRSLGEVGTAQIQSILVKAQSGEEVDPDFFRSVANSVIQNYERAVQYDPRNQNNYIGLADFYTGLASLGTEGVYTTAKELYSKSLELKPNNPGIFLKIAQLELVNKNIPAARAAIDKALELKPNYSDAYLFLTQIELSQGSPERAINVLKRAGANNPNDPFVYFQLGLLEYDNANFKDAVLAFERSVSLNPNFQNAKYFLGLSYYEVDEVPSSLRQFEELLKLNKQNQDLISIVKNLRNNQPPIAVQEKINTLEELPLDDDIEVDAEDLESVE